VLQADFSEELDPPGLSLGAFLCQTVMTLSDVDAIIKIASDTPLFRALRHKEGRQYRSFTDVGPPPADKARNNRMSPAGVPDFYLAFEDETALAETRQSPEQELVLASFRAIAPMFVADLTRLPAIPSIFDVGAYDRRKALQFLHKFRDEVSKPVIPTSSFCAYRPTQVFCEVLRSKITRPPLDGIVYLSSKRQNGRNLALFTKPQRPFDKLVKWLCPVKHHGCIQ
jgi:hypothetical protein